MTTIKLVEPYLALDINGITLVSYLAQQMNHEAVIEMLGHGASLAEAIYGYASIGKEEEVARLLARCDESNKKECIGRAIRGYARADACEKIVAIADFKSYMPELILGLAQAGNERKVTAHLDKRLDLYAQAVEGYASANKGAALKCLVKGTRFYPLAIFHAARAGHVDLVNDLLAECGISPGFRLVRSVSSSGEKSSASITDISAYTWFNHAVKGYMAGRHFNEAIDLLARGASITHCLSELKDSDGKPNHDLYIAFLAHIKDPTLREKVLANIAFQSAVQPSLAITSSDLERLAVVMTYMQDENLNYLEACHKADDTSYEPKEGEVTLSSLAGLIDIDDALSSSGSSMSM